VNKHLNQQVEELITEASLDDDQIEKLRRKCPKDARAAFVETY